MRSSVIRHLLSAAMMLGLASSATAQISVSQLLRNSVEKVDERYKGVADAIVMFQRNNARVAMALLKDSCEKNKELPPAEVLYAQLCFANNKADAGRAVLEIAAVQQEADPEPWVMLADLALRANRLAEADVLFQKGLEKTGYMSGNQKRQKSLQINAQAGLAMVDERRGLWKEAQEHLSRWMELDPENQSAMRRLAAAYFSQEKFDDAKSTLDKIRENNEDQPLSEVVMGVLHQKNGQQEESEKMMKEAVKKGADDLVTRLAVAEWALTAGKIDMAKENTDAAAKIDPEAARAKILQGRVKRFEGDDEGAESVFRTIYDESPASFTASNELVRAVLAQGDDNKYKQAVQYAQVNASRYKDPRTARGREAAATFAWGLHKLGQDAAAERIIQQVITSGEVSPQIGYFAAMIYKKRGRVDVARQLLDRSLKSYIAFPEQESAKQLLDALSDEVKQQQEEQKNSAIEPATEDKKPATEKQTSSSAKKKDTKSAKKDNDVIRLP